MEFLTKDEQGDVKLVVQQLVTYTAYKVAVEENEQLILALEALQRGLWDADLEARTRLERMRLKQEREKREAQRRARVQRETRCGAHRCASQWHHTSH